LQTVRIELQIGLSYEIDQYGADFIFNIHAAHTPRQRVAAEYFSINQPVTFGLHTSTTEPNRIVRLKALPGSLVLSYTATVDILHHREDPANLREMAIGELPNTVLPYLYPSRYCQSDYLITLASKLFGQIPRGYCRILAIQEWVRSQILFKSNSSNTNTSALDTLNCKVGICRDFAHLMIALCRALNIPARFVTGTDYGADPILGPPDFHAYVEVYLSHQWYIFDPSDTTIPEGLVRFGTGRDAADVAFATIFGEIQSKAPYVRATAIEDPLNGFILPQIRKDALSSGYLMP
jgi:transglutaminase-like putative cysteine protease